MRYVKKDENTLNISYLHVNDSKRSTFKNWRGLNWEKNEGAFKAEFDFHKQQKIVSSQSQSFRSPDYGSKDAELN